MNVRVKVESDKWIRYLHVCIIEESSTVGPQKCLQRFMHTITNELFVAYPVG